MENSICVILPVLQTVNLSGEEKIVYDMMSYGVIVSSKDVAVKLGCGKSKASEILKRLVKNDYVEILGNGKSTRYKLK